MHGLNPHDLSLIKHMLTPFAKHVTMVGIFGSRATGKYRPNSDIDLLLYGDLSEKMVDRITSDFTESLLPITVDVQAYDLIAYTKLKQHIDAVMQPLFTQQELIG